MFKWLFEDKPPEFDGPAYWHDQNINYVVRYCERLGIGPDELNELLELVGNIRKARDNQNVKWSCVIVDGEKHFKLNEDFLDHEYYNNNFK
jgi:hypothetical protein|tara:strand:+ start:1821 stop:2093 length:273 start_codon:yes stop_codon:yes gene_type:complete